MHKENILRQAIALQPGKPSAIEHQCKPRRGVIGWLLSLVPRSKHDLTLAEWRRIEFRNEPPPCPARDVVNQFQWRI
jgi:hypothetical protein